MSGLRAGAARFAVSGLGSSWPRARPGSQVGIWEVNILLTGIRSAGRELRLRAGPARSQQVTFLAERSPTENIFKEIASL